MTDHFREQGAALLRNGYLIVPIRKGEKRPAISAWQNARLGLADTARYPDHGVGVLCGQGEYPVMGIDIDISHPTIGAAVIAWCQKHIGSGGERVGAAPRMMLVYRAQTAGWAKGASVQFLDPSDPLKPSGKENNQQVEILGLGQQFVAYHQHPDTGRDYEWIDLFGGIEHLAASELPVITEAHVTGLLAEVSRLVRLTPGVKPFGSAESPVFASNSDADDLMSLTARVGMSIAEITELVSYLANDGDSYDTWSHVGMALHHEYGGTEHDADALALWKDYGSRSSKDSVDQYDYKWRTFGRHAGSPSTLRWLLKICYMAKSESQHDQRRSALDQAKALIKEQTDSLRLGSKTLVDQLKNLLLPDDQFMRTEIIGAWQAQYKALTKTSMPITQVRALLVGPRAATVQAKRPLTEFGNAERMLDRYAEGLMYVPETARWHIWTGVYWRTAELVEIAHLAKETIRGLVSEADEHEDRAEFFQFCALSQQARMVANMLTLASSDPRVVVPAAELDKNPNLIGVKNGVVNLLTGQLMPADQEYRITLVAGCEYNPAARAPLFEKTLRDVFFDDESLGEYVMRTFGYALMGQPREDVMFIPFGNGSNGKSTIFNAVRLAFGGYGTSADAHSFVSDSKGGNAGGPREDLLRLKGSRFVYVNEPDENGELREGMVKSMTGGDAITARGINAKSSLTFLPTWVIYMPTNHKPIIKGSDNGIWRRMGLLPFERNFDKDLAVPKDPRHKEKVALELPGILALIVRAALRYQQDGLTMPTKVLAARDSYRAQMDLLAEWLDEHCEMAEDATASSKELWESWEMFARSRGLLTYIRSSTALGRRLDSRFESFRGTGGVRLRRGLRIKTSLELF